MYSGDKRGTERGDATHGRYSSRFLRLAVALFVLVALSGSMIALGLGQMNSSAEDTGSAPAGASSPTSSADSSASPTPFPAPSGQPSASPGTSLSDHAKGIAQSSTAPGSLTAPSAQLGQDSFPAKPKMAPRGEAVPFGATIDSNPNCTVTNTVNGNDHTDYWTWTYNTRDNTAAIKAIANKPALYFNNACIKLPSKVVYNGTEYKVVTVDYGAMSYARDAELPSPNSIEQIDIPDTVTLVYAFAFLYTPIRHVHLSQNLETISYKAFGGSNMQDIDFSQSPNLKIIEESAFSVNQFKHLDLRPLEGHIQTLGAGAFRWNQITDLQLPATPLPITTPQTVNDLPDKDHNVNWKSAVAWQQPEEHLTPQESNPQPANPQITINQLFKRIEFGSSNLTNIPFTFHVHTADSDLPTSGVFRVSDMCEFTGDRASGTSSNCSTGHASDPIVFDTSSKTFTLKPSVKSFIFRWDYADANSNLLYHGQYIVRVQYKATMYCPTATNPSELCTWDDPSIVNPQVVQSGKQVVEPAKDPKKACNTDGYCYSFSRWTTDFAGTTDYSFSQPVSGPVKLYAQWEILMALPPAGEVPKVYWSSLALMTLAFSGGIGLCGRKAYSVLRAAPTRRPRA
ncbi:hypothetical protein KIMH_13480 [Bombiscardovia apis]|uniref:Uncharacterized protein n=1 Tax=Bombiscardovia apis TaxID=2932182 RepID=A0ABM8BE89_9BIFI|nr:leucine-rich repeat protein [Bombiscardovia apis]BDR55237.1 hypothetical protein KIMH_13480 [Bombiscardovia apis]